MSDLILFVDTETTGMCNFKLPIDHPSQPRMVQVAAILSTAAGDSVSEFSTVINPLGDWKIHPDAEKVHGFSTEYCEKYGMPLPMVLGVLVQMWELCSIAVAHNSNFDSRIIDGEFFRTDGPTTSVKPWHCTMLESAPIVGIPSLTRPGEFKWPKLAEAYKHFMSADLESAHDALADVRACKDIYFAMRKVVA